MHASSFTPEFCGGSRTFFYGSCSPKYWENILEPPYHFKGGFAFEHSGQCSNANRRVCSSIRRLITNQAQAISNWSKNPICSLSVNMASLLTNFMTGLQQENSFSISVTVISDNARTAKHAITNNDCTKSARPSRWEAESEKVQVNSPKVPCRRSFVARVASPLPSQ